MNRGDALLRAAFALAAASLPRAAVAAPGAVRLSLPSPGSAGGVWKPLIESDAAFGRVNATWIGGDPGGVEVQLIARTLDVSAFGSLGATEANVHGTDATIFAPGLNNHGRWIVRGESTARSPKDLRGKRIATLPETSDTYRQARMAAALAHLDLANDFAVVHGPATANLALFERGDVEAVITIEPTATRLVAGGAREIARVGDMWRDATGDPRPMFLVGQAASAAWLAANRDTARTVAALFTSANERIRARPAVLSELHAAFGIPDTETAAIRALPARLRDIYAVEWDDVVFAGLDRQIEVAVRLGLIEHPASRRVYGRA